MTFPPIGRLQEAILASSPANLLLFPAGNSAILLASKGGQRIGSLTSEAASDFSLLDTQNLMSDGIALPGKTAELADQLAEARRPNRLPLRANSPEK